MSAVLQDTAKYKNMLISAIKVGVSIWMLISVLVYLILSNTLYYVIYTFSQLSGIPWIEEYFRKAHEFLLQIFTSSYLY